ncbi:MAG: flagellar hook protein FlgE [Myxococcota bacterium]
MSLFNTLNTGASGMGASSTTLSVIGDNIANIGTVGFKGSAATFADAFPNVVGGLGGLSQIGNGAMVGDVAIDYAQGNLNQSGSALDVAILGSGFFQVSGGDGEMYYTRDGSFHLDADSFVVNSAGMRLQGYPAIDGTVTSALGDLQIDGGEIPQQATTEVVLSATLSAEADFTDEPLDALRAATPLDGTAGAPTLEQLSQAADFSTSVTVYDSLGKPHDVTLFFERDSASPDTWNTYAVVDGGQVDTDGDGLPNGTPGSAFEIGTGSVTFDTDGNLVSTTGITPTAGWTFPGTDPLAANFAFGLDAAGNATEGELRMGGTTSYLTSIAQDGRSSGTLDGLRVEADGTLIGTYSNGEEQALGQLATATFASNAGLDRVGGNLYRANANSGDPAMGVAGSGGRGTVAGYALEGSNVELEEQFVHMIQAQRSYQANTGVISTADEALQQLINLV